jgi:hypothetical protein
MSFSNHLEPDVSQDGSLSPINNELFRMTTDQKDRELQQHFAERMKEFGRKSVAVLLLYWEESDLENIEKEVSTPHGSSDRR